MLTSHCFRRRKTQLRACGWSRFIATSSEVGQQEDGVCVWPKVSGRHTLLLNILSVSAIRIKNWSNRSQRTFTSDSVNLVNDGRRRQNVHWRKKSCSPSKNINCSVKMCHIFVQTHSHYCTCNIFFLQHTFVGFWSLSGQVRHFCFWHQPHTHTCQKRFQQSSLFIFNFFLWQHDHNWWRLVGHYYRPFFLNMGRHLGQYHFPLGLWLRSMHPKWNHSMGQSWLSHPIISP